MSDNEDTGEFLKIVRSEPVSLDEWHRVRHEYSMNNPESCEVMEMAHNMAKFFEDESGYPRHKVCEGLFLASLQLAFRRSDQRFIERPEDQRAFHLWALRHLKNEMDVTTTAAQQAAYEAELGQRPLWLFDSENFGADDGKKTKQ